MRLRVQSVNNWILQGDSLDQLKIVPTGTVDMICTDPPYGYSFMGKDWDKAVPSVELWKECLRVLKPGGFAFIMSAPRSDVLSRMIVRIEDAGFRVDFTPLYWTYASGFPKAMNIGKMVDKRNGVEPLEIRKATLGMANNPQWNAVNNQEIMPPRTTPQAKALDGSYGGFQPKPAVEVIIVAMKPLSEKTYVDQALKNGKGITWLDGARIPTEASAQGRFPANLLVSDDVLNDGKDRKSGAVKPHIENHQNASSFQFHREKTFIKAADSGSYSRYFSLDAWAATLPFLIVPKASKAEKNKGLEEFDNKATRRYGERAQGSLPQQTPQADIITKNVHPTVKPLALMSYLITLGSRPGDMILDPFLGSGTTAVAAKQLGRDYIGIEREPEYITIANARLKAVEPRLL